jgi:hypothetical protein
MTAVVHITAVEDKAVVADSLINFAVRLMETVGAVEDLVAVVGFRLSQQLRIGGGFQDDETYKQSKKKEVKLGRLNLK